jgi:hypothetical protein
MQGRTLLGGSHPLPSSRWLLALSFRDSREEKEKEKKERRRKSIPFWNFLMKLQKDDEPAIDQGTRQ